MGSLEEVQRLTRDYASFAWRRSGLGNVLGGAIGLAVFAISLGSGPGLLTAALAVTLTASWFVGKEVIRARLYRPFGRASEGWPDSERRQHLVGVRLLAAALALFAAFLAARGEVTNPAAWPYLLFCAATPVLVWRFLRTQNEALVGVYLLFDCAICCSGHAPPALALLCLPVTALALIGSGLGEHRRFRRLAAQLSVRREPLA